MNQPRILTYVHRKNITVKNKNVSLEKVKVLFSCVKVILALYILLRCDVRSTSQITLSELVYNRLYEMANLQIIKTIIIVKTRVILVRKIYVTACTGIYNDIYVILSRKL